MNLQQYKAITESLYAELGAVMTRHGLKVGKVRATVDELSGTVSLKLELADAALRDADGNSTTPEAQRYRQLCDVFGMKSDWLGREFVSGGKRLKLVGLADTRGPKKVVLESGGKRYVIRPESVVAHMSRQAA